MFNIFKRQPVGMVDNLVPSPPDERDFPLSGVMPEILRYPEEYPRPFDLTIINQGSTPTCVGCSGATIKQFLELKEKEFILPDWQWLYAQCKLIDGMPTLNGTFFRAVLTVLKNTGCKLQGQNNDPSIYRIAEYRRVDDLSFEGIKKTIAVYGHVLGGWRGTNAGWGSEIIRAPRAGEQTWGHATALTHYFKDYLGGQNSWGEYKHKNGLFKSPEDYLPFEAWVVLLDTPNVSKKETETGWVAAMYVLNDQTFRNLNVRTGPGLNYKIIKTLPKGTPVKEYGTPKVTADGYVWMEIVL